MSKGDMWHKGSVKCVTQTSRSVQQVNRGIGMDWVWPTVKIREAGVRKRREVFKLSLECGESLLKQKLIGNKLNSKKIPRVATLACHLAEWAGVHRWNKRTVEGSQEIEQEDPGYPENLGPHWRTHELVGKTKILAGLITLPYISWLKNQEKQSFLWHSFVTILCTWLNVHRHQAHQYKKFNINQTSNISIISLGMECSGCFGARIWDMQYFLHYLPF